MHCFLGNGAAGKQRNSAAIFIQANPVRFRLLRSRAGVTLIELLLVVGILTVLATIALSSVRGLLKDQKVNQAGRLVQQYIETAKIRAITSGRPVAVFLERAGWNPPANYTATRLSIGEVFPPYCGDSIGATGSLWDVAIDTRHIADGHADQIRFTPTDVFSGFGISPTEPGFVTPGDLIQFEGSDRLFEIVRYDLVSSPNNLSTQQWAVTFFNPPAPTIYNTTLVGPFSTQEPGFPLAAGSTLPSFDSPTPDLTTVFPRRVTFRIYRRPTKSLVGAITLPRGTCVDLYASGFGRGNSSADGTFTPPAINNPGAIANGVSRSSYSRVAIVFDPTGKPSGFFKDQKVKGASQSGPAEADFEGGDIGAKLYLMVGRTDQVTDDVVRPSPESRDTALSNILDPANSWISINPLTGLVTTAPVTNVPDQLIANYRNGNATYQDIVNSARTLASVGVNNAGQ